MKTSQPKQGSAPGPSDIIPARYSLFDGITGWFSLLLLGKPAQSVSPEMRRRTGLMAGIAVVGAGVLILFGIFAGLQGHFLLAGLDMLLALILLLNLLDGRVRKQYSFNIEISIWLTGFFFVYLYLMGGVNQTAFVWYYVFPLASVFLLGSQKGLLVSLSMLLPVFGNILLAGRLPYLVDYGLDFELRFVFSYLVVNIFAFLLENGAEKNRSEIMLINENLEHVIDARTSELLRLNQQLSRQVERYNQAKNQLIESEKRYRIMFEKSGNAIFFIDLHTGRYLDANPAAEGLTGLPIATIKRLRISDLTPSGANKCLLGLSNTKEAVDMQEVEFSRPDGSTRTALLTAAPLNEEVAMGIALDISELKAAEKEREKIGEQLRQSQKMEAIGTLAGGIAHDFNNILSAIIGYTDLVVMKLPHNHPVQPNLQQVLSAADRAKQLTRQILTFSRKTTVGEMEPVQIGVVVHEVLELLRATIPRTISITSSLDQHLLVMGDSGQVHQLVLNLCTNAVQAMQAQEGELRVSLESKKREERKGYRGEGSRGEQMVVLTVTDNGCGMPREVQDKVFDPFYTTKEIGEGTGMGLSVVHGIAENLSAEIVMESEVGKGSHFEVWIPAASPLGRPPANDHPARQPLPTGDEHVVFIDDELFLVDIGRQLLESLGYRVTVFTESVAALDFVVAATDPVDLVIADNTMPHLTGVELTGEIKKAHPDLPVILCSGNISEQELDCAQQQGLAAFMTKPLYVDKVAHSVRNVLDGRSGEKGSGSAHPLNRGESEKPGGKREHGWR